MAQKSETHQLQVTESQSSKDLTQTELRAWMMSEGQVQMTGTWRLVTSPVGHHQMSAHVWSHHCMTPAPTVFVMNFSFPVSLAAKL